MCVEQVNRRAAPQRSRSFVNNGSTHSTYMHRVVCYWVLGALGVLGITGILDQGARVLDA